MGASVGVAASAVRLRHGAEAEDELEPDRRAARALLFCAFSAAVERQVSEAWWSAVSVADASACAELLTAEEARRYGGFEPPKRTRFRVKGGASELDASRLGLDLLELADDQGRRALHLAVERGHPELAAWLLSASADADAARPDGLRPLHLAMDRADDDALRMLFDARANADAVLPDGERPLQLALGRADDAALRMLLGARAEADAVLPSGERPLHLAMGRPDDIALRLLLEARANANVDAPSGERPLHLALGRPDDAALRMLLAARANADATAPSGEHPLHLALGRPDDAALRMLLDARANACATAPSGEHPLHLALGRPDAAATRMLLDARANANATAPSGEHPLHLALGRADAAATRMLLAARADADAIAPSGERPLHIALGRTDDAATRLLIDARADVQAALPGGERPLHLALGRADDAVALRLLLDARAAPDATFPGGERPLQAAIVDGAEAAVRALLGARADAGAPLVPLGRGAMLRAAVELGHEPIVRLLLSARASPGGEVSAPEAPAEERPAAKPSKWGRAAKSAKPEAVASPPEEPPVAAAESAAPLPPPPLHLAVERCDEAIARALLEARADADAPQSGDTALGRCLRRPPDDTAFDRLARLLCVEGGASLTAAVAELAAESASSPSERLLRAAALGRDWLTEEALRREGLDDAASICEVVRQPFGWTLLHEAAVVGSTALARRVLDAAAAVELALGIAGGGREAVASREDGAGRTALHCAAQEGHEAVVDFLVFAAPAMCDAADRLGRTPLWLAARGGHVACALRLASARADPLLRELVGGTCAAWQAARRPAGADEPQRLLPALLGDGPLSEEWLLSATTDDAGHTLLHVAAREDAVPAMQWIAEHADAGGALPRLIRARARNGATALRLACLEGAEDATRLLLDWGAVDDGDAPTAADVPATADDEGAAEDAAEGAASRRGSPRGSSRSPRGTRAAVEVPSGALAETAVGPARAWAALLGHSACEALLFERADELQEATRAARLLAYAGARADVVREGDDT